jgi:SAM-dependent methyltransferase
MSDPIAINLKNWDERAQIHARDKTGDYMLDAFRAGADALHEIDAAEIGDITGKRVLHLQCHIGRDTLCLVRRGAIATGLDFSGEALKVAHQLSAETGLKAEFVQGRVEEAPLRTPGPFDLVFTTWGTIVWLPDVHVWAKAIASVLKPGGELYFADCHPVMMSLDERNGVLLPGHDHDTPPDQPNVIVNEHTYTGDTTKLVNKENREWNHSLSRIFTALMDAGLTITMFHEHEVLPWQAFKLMVQVPGFPRLWKLPDGHPRMPLSFSLRAKKNS